MTINAGKYRHRSTLYRKPTGVGDFSGDSVKPQAIRTLWVQVIPRGSSETTSTQQTESVDTFEIRTPWAPYELDSTMAIENERGWFEIQGVVNDSDADQEIVITATRVNNG